MSILHELIAPKDDADDVFLVREIHFNDGDTLADGSLYKITMPVYKIDNFPLTYVDNPLYEANFTDWFDGIQFRFDNGPNTFNGNPLALVELKKVIF